MSFDALVRFEEDGHACYGDLLEATADGFKIARLEGNLEDGFSKTESDTITVSKVRPHIAGEISSSIQRLPC